MADETGRNDRDEGRRRIRRTLKRPLSLLVVAATLMGSLLVVERTDTGATRDSGATLEGELAGHRPRPAQPLDVAGAIEAGEYAAADVRIAIERTEGQLGNGPRARLCEVLLGARARFLVRIDILIDRVPAAEPQLLEIRAEVLAEVDAALAEFDCPISP